MLSHNYLTEILDYSPWTGDWYWKVDRGNNLRKGKKAGCIKSENYVYIKIDGKDYKAHTLAWFYMLEEWPINQLDHADTIRNNNRFYNLREATNAQNQWNKRLGKNNKSGYKGVYWNKKSQKYQTTIKKDSTPYYLGSFDCPIEAAKAYDNKAIEFFGEFANLNFKTKGEGE